MDEAEQDNIETILNGYQEYADDCEELTDWERSFMNDQIERYEKYGARTRFSEKQMDIINRVYAKLPI